jgi:pimeloyl-ACP methyl ester carboxylesterase
MIGTMNGADGHLPLALLIPGLDGTGLLYYRQLEPLELRYRVRAWELPRHAAFDYPDLVDEIDRATEAEQPGSMVVVGESFGGTVAMHLALARPARIRTLVLVNTFARYRRQARIRLACRLAPLLRWPAAQLVKNSVAERTLALEGIEAEDRRRYREIIERVAPAGYRRRLQLVSSVDLRARLPEIAVPTILFASGRDKLVPSVDEARFMAARIPRARLHEFPRAGHALLLTPGFSLADYL